MISSQADGTYRFHMKNFNKIDIRADKVVTSGGIIYIFLKERVIMKLKEREVLCWNLKRP